MKGLVSKKITIPVPRLLDYGTHPDGRQYLVTQRIGGVCLNSLLVKDDADIAYSNALEFVQGTVLPQLEELISNKRGIDGSIVMPPSWLSPDFEPPWKGKKKSWKTLALKEPGYVFHHGDLAAQNIIMDPQTLQVKALIDWEYAGFFLPGMQRWPGMLDKAAYDRSTDDMAGAIEDFLAEEYLECYRQWDHKEELEQLIKSGQLPDPQPLRQAQVAKTS